MFDFHLHSNVSFDSTASSLDMANAALKNGLKEICFTDHYDYAFNPQDHHDLFSLEEYSAAYDNLSLSGIQIRKGVEFGLTTWNSPHLKELLKKRKFDFVIGSIHFAGQYDPYFSEYWQGKTKVEAFETYLKEVFECIKIHDNFDVLGHLTYVCKSPCNKNHSPLLYSDFKDIADEIMKLLIHKKIGLEINTSGKNKIDPFLPNVLFLQRFKELGGEIVTIGSDAHSPNQVGAHIREATQILKDIFGYVCTFENRKPIFHKL